MGHLTGFKEQVSPEDTIMNLLQIGFADPNDPELIVRADLLRKAFAKVEPAEAAPLYGRLSNKRSSEKLVVLFHHVLSTALRNDLLQILQRKTEEARSTTRTAAPLVQQEERAITFRALPDRATIYSGLEPDSFVTGHTLARTRAGVLSYADRLRQKIRSLLEETNSSIQAVAKKQVHDTRNGLSAVIIPASHDWDQIDRRLLFLRYYLESLANANNVRVSTNDLVEQILRNELAFEESRSLNYQQAFPEPDFVARYGSPTGFANQRDFRCGVSHHRYGSPPAPETHVAPLEPYEIFALLLEQLHLTEAQYFELGETVRRETFTDDEIAGIFAEPHIFRQYLLSDGSKTLRAFILHWHREQAYIAKYGHPNDAFRGFATVNPNRIKSTLFRASQNQVVYVTYEALVWIKTELKKAAPYISLICDFIPYVGPIKGLIEGIVGVDLITGDELAGWQRVLAILPAGIEHCGTILKGAKYVAKGAASLAKSDELLIVLVLATKTGKHPIQVIQNMKAVATMSERAVVAAGDEAKAMKGAKALTVTETQAEALNEVKKTVDQINAARPPSGFGSIKDVRPVLPATTVAKHYADARGANGAPDQQDRMVHDRLQATPRKPGSPAPPSDPALPASDSTPKNELRRRKRRERRPKTAGEADARLRASRFPGSGRKPPQPPITPRPVRDMRPGKARDFFKQNRGSKGYSDRVNAAIEKLPAKGEPRGMLERLIEIDKMIRDDYVAAANEAIGRSRTGTGPFVRAQRSQSSAGGSFAGVVNDEGTLSLTGTTPDAKIRVEFDSVDFRKKTFIETKRSNVLKTVEELADQMKRQAQFSKDWNFGHIVWETFEERDVGTFLNRLQEARKRLPRDLADKIEIRNPTTAHDELFDPLD
jgi:Pre-toxin TG